MNKLISYTLIPISLLSPNMLQTNAIQPEIPGLVTVKDVIQIQPIPVKDTLQIQPLPLQPTVLKTMALVDAMILVESMGDDSAYCKSEEAVGCLQIRPIMVREVNRLLKRFGSEERFSLTDRWSREKSIDIFDTWRLISHPDDSDEVIARCWNGGPRGWKKKATNHYWDKVTSYLYENEKS
jgi:hypothetical protein